MREKRYNIKYYHGLDSFLSAEKRNILERFGNVTAPTYDYRDAEVLKSINETFDDSTESAVLIGSSFGGYLASLFSAAYDIPCLLFNPALVCRSIEFLEDKFFDREITSHSYIVLGLKDDVINCADNLVFIKEHLNGPKEIVVEKDMGHRVPLDIFEKHVELFFGQLEKLSPG